MHLLQIKRNRIYGFRFFVFIEYFIILSIMITKRKIYPMLNPFIIGKRIYLRSPEPADEEIIALSENHPDPRETLYYALPSNIRIHKERIEAKQRDPHTVFFTIATINPDQPIGCTSLVRIDWVGRMATFYIAIARKKDWDHGFGREATRLMVDYAFATLNLNRVQLHVSTENVRAVKAYEKEGFLIEGTLRQAMFHENHYSDFYLMAILREDWEKGRKP